MKKKNKQNFIWQSGECELDIKSKRKCRKVSEEREAKKKKRFCTLEKQLKSNAAKQLLKAAQICGKLFLM